MIAKHINQLQPTPKLSTKMEVEIWLDSFTEVFTLILGVIVSRGRGPTVLHRQSSIFLLMLPPDLPTKPSIPTESTLTRIHSIPRNLENLGFPGFLGFLFILGKEMKVSYVFLVSQVWEGVVAMDDVLNLTLFR